MSRYTVTVRCAHPGCDERGHFASDTRRDERDTRQRYSGKWRCSRHTKTPFSIEEIATSVVKLKAAGLQATDEAVTAYGDLASTMGKNVDEMTEAVKDAVTGEFERLKEFNIKASKSGDTISFTFKGVTTDIAAHKATLREAMAVRGGARHEDAVDDERVPGWERGRR